MRRVVASTAGLAVLVAALTAGASGSTGAAVTAVGVGEREWRIALYRSHVPVGRVRFNVRNFGEDDHDLAVRNRPASCSGSCPRSTPHPTDS